MWWAAGASCGGMDCQREAEAAMREKVKLSDAMHLQGGDTHDNGNSRAIQYSQKSLNALAARHDLHLQKKNSRPAYRGSDSHFHEMEIHL